MHDNTTTVQRRLSAALEASLRDYVEDLGGEPCSGLYKNTLAVMEKTLLEFVLKNCNGNLSASAKMLGISRTTLSRKMAGCGFRLSPSRPATHAHSKRPRQRQR